MPREDFLKEENIMNYEQSQAATRGEQETISLIAAGKVSATDVYDTEGEKIGAIYDVMIDKVSGQVAYAVLSFGEILGLGEKYHPLPWEKLAYNELLGGYALGLKREMLAGAPAYGSSDAPDWSKGYRGQIDEYYALIPPVFGERVPK
jgi:PRC-barrel domain